MSDRVVRKTALMFQTSHARQAFDGLISDAALVEVEGDWDTLKRRWLDPPKIVSGYGNVSPDYVAKSTGIAIPGEES